MNHVFLLQVVSVLYTSIISSSETRNKNHDLQCTFPEIQKGTVLLGQFNSVLVPYCFFPVQVHLLTKYD